MGKRNPLTTGCGDWHLGWGFGGHDKLGKLTLKCFSSIKYLIMFKRAWIAAKCNIE